MMAEQKLENPEILTTCLTADLAGVLKVSPWPAEAFLLAERLPQEMVDDRQERQDLLRFAWVSNLDRRLDLARYTSGRIFCRQFELRWDQQVAPGKTRLVYSGSAEHWSGLLAGQADWRREKTLSEYTCKTCYLFGEVLASERVTRMGLEEDPSSRYYAEVRVPRILRYPRLEDHPVKRRLQLAVYEYLDTQSGAIDWFRFADVQSAE